jgi:formate--tetrahydrofolate ligase
MVALLLDALWPSLVQTLEGTPALVQGGVALSGLASPDAAAVGRGRPDLERHVENVRLFGETPIVALNRFGNDHEHEIAVVRRRCEKLGVPFAVSDHHPRGGEGAEDLARALVAHADRPDDAQRFRPLYPLEAPVEEKILAVAQKMYGARDVCCTPQARSDFADVERLGHAGIPVCIAKTPNSLSDDPKRRGRARDSEVAVRGIQINAGAGFPVVLTGDILCMPGLPRHPRAEQIGVVDGRIVGPQ